MEESNTLYFAYGSNMNRSQMAHRCPGSEPIGKATLPGYRFIINQTGYATIVPSGTAWVEGVLWLLKPRHIETLDEYEDHEEGFYDRCYRAVQNGEGKDRMALVYIDHRQTTISPPNDGYLERVVEGAIEHGLTEGYIDRLRSFGVRE